MTAPDSSDPQFSVTLDEVRAEMDTATANGFDAAQQRALNRKLAEALARAHERIAELEAAAH